MRVLWRPQRFQALVLSLTFTLMLTCWFHVQHSSYKTQPRLRRHDVTADTYTEHKHPLHVLPVTYKPVPKLSVSAKFKQWRVVNDSEIHSDQFKQGRVVHDSKIQLNHLSSSRESFPLPSLSKTLKASRSTCMMRRHVICD